MTTLIAASGHRTDPTAEIQVRIKGIYEQEQIAKDVVAFLHDIGFTSINIEPGP